MEIRDFRDFMNLMEGSFTEADIPKYFYVGCFLSEDIVRPKPWTPPGAVCTLVGLEGVSSSASIFAFTKGVCLQMPGKELVRLNKITKVMHTNREYYAGSAFKPQRRQSAGSGGPGSHGTGRPSSKSSLSGFIDSFLHALANKYADMADYSDNIKLSDGTTMSKDEIIALMSTTTPHRFAGAPISDRTKRTKQQQRSWATNKDDFAKMTFNTADLAGRLYAILSGKVTGRPGVSGPERLLEPSSQMIKKSDDFLPKLLMKTFGRDVSATLGDIGMSKLRKFIDRVSIPANKKKELLSWINSHIDDSMAELIHHLKATTGRKLTRIQQMVSDSIPGINSHASEAEWIMKRQLVPSNSRGMKCKACRAFIKLTNEQAGDTIQCPACNTDNEIPTDKLREARPMLHVPEGSIMYILNMGVPSWFMPVIEDYKTTHNKSYLSTEEQVKVIVEHFKLYDKFSVHFVNDSNGATSKAANPDQKRSYDPQYTEHSKQLRELLDRGITKIDHLQKLMQKKHNVDPVKVRAILGRWEHLKVVTIDRGEVTISDHEFDENSTMVYRTIKSSEGIMKAGIEDATGVSGTDLDDTLKKLIEQDKVQQLPDGRYDIKLSNEEMSQISPIEKDILEAIEKTSSRDTYYIKLAMPDPGQYSESEIRTHIRLLILKRKIVKGPLSGNYMLTVDPDEPLRDDEKNLLGFLREWPHTDMDSIVHEWPNIAKNQLVKTVERLIARHLVIASSEDSIRLNTEKTQPLENAKQHSKLAESVIQLVSKHFYSVSGEVAAGLNKDSYMVGTLISKYTTKGILTTSDNGRMVPVNGQYLPAEQTVEAQLVGEFAMKKEVVSKDEIVFMLKSKNSQWYYYTTEYLLKALEGKVIKYIYHPLQNKDVYYHVDQPFKLDLTEYKKMLVEIFEASSKPLGLIRINTLYSDTHSHDKYLAVEGIKTVVKAMVEDGTLAAAKDFSGKDVWHLTHQEGPKDISHYKEMVKAILTKSGPMGETKVREILIDDYDLQDDSARHLVHAMLHTDPPELETHKDQFLYYSVVKLPGQSMPGEQHYLDMIFKTISAAPLNYSDLREKILEDFGVRLKGTALEELSGKLEELGKVEISTDAWGSEIVHLPGVEPNQGWYEKIKKFVDESGGSATAQSIYRHMDEYSLYSDYTKPMLQKMVEKEPPMLHIVKNGSLSLYTTDANLKVPHLEDLVNAVIKSLQAGGTSPVRANNIENVVSDSLDENGYPMYALLDLVFEGKVNVTKLDYTDFWYGTYFTVHDENIVDINARKIHDEQEAKEYVAEYSHFKPEDLISRLGSEKRVREFIVGMVAQNKLFPLNHTPDANWMMSAVYSNTPPKSEEELEQSVVDFLKSQNYPHSPSSIHFATMPYEPHDKFKALISKLVNQGKITQTQTSHYDWWYETAYKYVVPVAAAPAPQAGGSPAPQASAPQSPSGWSSLNSPTSGQASPPGYNDDPPDDWS